MAKSENEQAERVRSAKAWLERAEKSFDNKADVRGELNLMLAEAEMKNLRKNHGTGRKLRRLAAIGTAVLLGFGIWQFTRPVAEQPDFSQTISQEETAKPASKSDSAAVDKETAPADDASPAAVEEETVPAVEVVPVSPDGNRSQPAATQGEPVQEKATAAPETVPYTQPVEKKVLTDQQVQAAVQDARHSLRGAESKK